MKDREGLEGSGEIGEDREGLGRIGRDREGS